MKNFFRFKGVGSVSRNSTGGANFSAPESGESDGISLDSVTTQPHLAAFESHYISNDSAPRNSDHRAVQQPNSGASTAPASVKLSRRASFAATLRLASVSRIVPSAFSLRANRTSGAPSTSGTTTPGTTPPCTTPPGGSQQQSLHEYLQKTTSIDERCDYSPSLELCAQQRSSSDDISSTVAPTLLGTQSVADSINYPRKPPETLPPEVSEEITSFACQITSDGAPTYPQASSSTVPPALCSAPVKTFDPSNISAYIPLYQPTDTIDPKPAESTLLDSRISTTRASTATYSPTPSKSTKSGMLIGATTSSEIKRKPSFSSFFPVSTIENAHSENPDEAPPTETYSPIGSTEATTVQPCIVPTPLVQEASAKARFRRLASGIVDTVYSSNEPSGEADSPNTGSQEPRNSARLLEGQHPLGNDGSCWTVPDKVRVNDSSEPPCNMGISLSSPTKRLSRLATNSIACPGFETGAAEVELRNALQLRKLKTTRVEM